MRTWLLAVLVLAAQACGGNGDNNNGSNNDSNNGEANHHDADVGHEDATAEEDLGPEPTPASGVSGEVVGTEVDMTGIAIASVASDGAFSILFTDRDLACDDLRFAPGETYFRFTVTPDDGEFRPLFYNELVAGIRAEAKTMPEGCAGEALLVGENRNVRPFTVILEDVSDETLGGTFDVELYVGLDNGSVAGTFNAVRCPMTLLPVCDDSL